MRSTWAYYNEIDKQKAAWLRELIKAGHIAPGEVDERSIQLVQPGDLAGFAQCHFFAGIGVWSYALRCAGWADERPVWTASCPCQPFSAAGQQKGFADERHLWPELFRLIAECRPECIVGEQVAKRNGLAWLDAVCDDLEGSGYACGAVVSPACGYGAPQIRERLYWMARRNYAGLEERQCERGDAGEQCAATERSSETEWLASLNFDGLQTGPVAEFHHHEHHIEPCGSTERMASAEYAERWPKYQCAQRSSATSFWSGCDWVLTRPQRLGDPPSLRPVEPQPQQMVDGSADCVVSGIDIGFPLAEKQEARVMRLRGYGDAIVAPQAEAFIRAVMEL